MKNITLFESIEKTVSKNRLAKKGEIDERVKTFKLDKNLNFDNGKIFYNQIQCGTYDENKRKLVIDQQKCLNSKGLNPLTSHPSLPTNATLEIQNGKNRHLIETDNLGRKTKITNIFKEKILSELKGNRANDEQTKAKMFGDEDGFVDTDPKYKDQGGHGSSASGGSLKEMAYIFPQAHKVNNSKEWKEIENAQRAEFSRENVNFQTINEFEYVGDSKRPSFVKSEINGVSNNKSKKFNNSNSDSVPVLANKPVKQPKFKKAYIPPVQSKAPSSSSSSSNKRSNSKPRSSSNSTNSPKIPIKLILAIVGIIILILLFLWFKDIFPFDSKINQNKVLPESEITIDNSNSNENVKIDEDSTQSKMSFAKPLDDLTKSVTNITEFNSIVENENIIPVIGSMFEYNSADISNNGKEILAGFVNEYNKLDVPYKILIEGFTCTIGSKESNEKLGEVRADNLKTELNGLGINENLIVIKPIGMENFVSTNSGKNDLVSNRRSNVTIISAE
jgi:outer membrane protein OmpA-like peptidoglycan-associated protein